MDFCVVSYTIRDGENEYSMTRLVSKEDAARFENNFWDLENPNIDGDIQWDQFGATCMRHIATQPVTAEEYQVLKKFL